MLRVVQAFVIDKATKKNVVSFRTLEDALEYVGGNFHSCTIIYYDDAHNEHNYNAEMGG